MKDLCATTQISLAAGLVARGYNLTFVNHDPEGSHGDWPWNHHQIPNNAPRGLRALFSGIKMTKWVSSLSIKGDAIALVDWRIANSLVPTLQKRKIPWILIDRSPPADRGILSALQWVFWKRSWKKVKKDENALGCVVSEAHRSFVSIKIGLSHKSIIILPAGVDLKLFQPKKRFENLTLIYHGRLDRHRGVMALPMLLRKANLQGVDAKLILIGEGDAFPSLCSIADHEDSIEVKPSLPQSALAEIVSRCHIGLLPMPKQKIWAISSPLKRSEYAACGLLIFGINHDGHRFSSQEKFDWMNLVNQEDFHQTGISWLASLSNTDIELLGKGSRGFAEENLSWDKTIDKLEGAIISLCE